LKTFPQRTDTPLPFDILLPYTVLF